MKSILIIDTPKDCDNCPCADGELGFCQADEKQRYCDWYKVPLWCPLKPMPKEEDIYEVGMDEEDTNAKRQWNKGWNACLEELENE